MRGGLVVRVGVLVTASAAAEGATYYVSSSKGNDANSGLSEASPLGTVARVNALALEPGDQVLFRW